MALSLKKRVRSKIHIASGGEDDANALGEVLHRSAGTSKSKKTKKSNDLLHLPPPHNRRDSNHECAHQTLYGNHPMIYRTTCPCDSHYTRQLLKHDYHLAIDQLFDLLFGSNEFVHTFRRAQRFYDDTATEWVMNEEIKCRERVLNYKVPYESALVGKGTVITREKQTLFHEVPGSHYVLETAVYNEGVKFSDTFTLVMRYCLVQTSPTTTRAHVTAQVQFVKSVFAIVRPVIEQNAYSASQEGLKDLNNRLNLISNFKMEKQRLSLGEATSRISPTEPGQSGRMSRHEALANTPSNSDHQKTDEQPPSVIIQPDKPVFIFIFIIGVLALIHLYLYFKLKHVDVLVDNLSHLIKMSSKAAPLKRRPLA